MANQPDLAAQIDTLTSQVATLQTLVYGLQNQQANPSPGLPQITKSSTNTSIPLVSQVQILSQKPGPTGIQVVVGFNEPSGPATTQIASYNVWVALGSNTPAVIASIEQSPCTFTVSSATAAVTGIVGVQTVMKDGTSVGFNLCPTTTLNLGGVPGNVQYFSNPGTALTAGVVFNLGTPITVPSAGTYLVLAAVQAGNQGATSGTLTCAVFKNPGGAVSTNYWVVFVGPNASANTIASNIGFYIVVCSAGDTIQVGLQSNVTQTYDLGVRILLLKQFAS